MEGWPNLALKSQKNWSQPWRSFIIHTHRGVILKVSWKPSLLFDVENTINHKPHTARRRCTLQSGTFTNCLAETVFSKCLSYFSNIEKSAEVEDHNPPTQKTRDPYLSSTVTLMRFYQGYRVTKANQSCLWLLQGCLSEGFEWCDHQRSKASPGGWVRVP